MRYTINMYLQKFSHIQAITKYNREWKKYNKIAFLFYQNSKNPQIQFLKNLFLDSPWENNPHKKQFTYYIRKLQIHLHFDPEIPLG